MNLLKQLPVLFFICFLALSCAITEDDGTYDPPGPDGVEMEYYVTANTGMIAKVRYRSKDSAMKTITLENHPAEWSKIMHAPPPFDAVMEVYFNNTTAVPQSYTLEIYIEGELAAHSTGLVAPNNTSSGAVSFYMDL